MNGKKTPLALTIAGGLVLSGSAFAMNDLASGYMLSASAQQDAQEATKAESKSGEGSCGAQKMDTDQDGKVSKAEFAAAHDGSDAKFDSHDGNGDGYIDAAEIAAHHKAGDGKAKTEGKCGEGKCGEGKCGGSR